MFDIDTDTTAAGPALDDPAAEAIADDLLPDDDEELSAPPPEA